MSTGLLPPERLDVIPETGTYGGPLPGLSDVDLADFLAGRRFFDREFGFADGLGGPRYNGDSCRACHFEPAFGGAGPRGTNVMRHGIANDAGDFTVPNVGTILHKQTALLDLANRPQDAANIFEHRQTPPLFGLGLIQSISDDTIRAAADPTDEDGDGISGRVSIVDGGRLGRFGWKAQVPTIAEFVRDAVSTELSMTLPAQGGLTFGKINDNDDIPDPELELEDARVLLRYLELLAPPPRQEIYDAAAVARGEEVFVDLGCAACHTPSLPGENGEVALYSDLLLHEILDVGALGIEDASANIREFRTAPLWGISQTAPYLHTGAADTLHQAILGHAGEATASRNAYEARNATDVAALLAFLETL